MSVPPGRGLSVRERVRSELELIRTQVTGVHGSLVATSDGLLVAHDVPDLEPDQLAALVATTRAVATSTTQATGRGEFREALTRGSLGYLAVFAAGETAIVAVVGTNALNLGMLAYQAREAIARIAACAPEFRGWGAAEGSGPGAAPSASVYGAESAYGADSGALPVRRTGTG